MDVEATIQDRRSPRDRPPARHVVVRPTRRIATGATALVALALLAGGCGGPTSPTSPVDAAVALPPAGAPFDYQIGEPYPPHAETRVVSRDRDAAPAPGLYSV